LLHDESLSLEQYIELPHVQALPRDATMYADVIDAALAEFGLVRKVALWEPSFLAMGHVVAQTEPISTFPTRVGTHFAHSLPIVAYDLPLAVPAAEVTMFWQPRSHEDVGAQVAQGSNRGSTPGLIVGATPSQPPRFRVNINSLPSGSTHIARCGGSFPSGSGSRTN
jgi:hypothetical protein